MSRSTAFHNGDAVRKEERLGLIQVVSEPRKQTIVVDTCVPVHEPKCFATLKEKERDVEVHLPWVVTEELDELKTRADIGWDAREAIRQIELDQCGEKFIKIHKRPKKGVKGLSGKKADYEIIATAIECRGKAKDPNDVIVMSFDANLRIWSREQGLTASDYPYTQVDAAFDSNLKRIHLLGRENFFREGQLECFRFDPSQIDGISLNEGFICSVNGNGPDNDSDSFLAIYKGDDRFRLVQTERDILGLRPFTLEDNVNESLVIEPDADKISCKRLQRKEKRERKRELREPTEVDFSANGRKNWQQCLAIEQLLDPSLELVFLQGGAGTGKTLIAMASAILQRINKSYEQIIIIRPAVHLEDHDSYGFLPGKLEEKMSPWLTPIKQAYTCLFKINPSLRKIVAKMEEQNEIIYESLDFIRGQTFHRSLIIVDEAQNLTPHQVKTVITRGGLGTKMVFTGDLGQIDRNRRLDRRNSGLAYAMRRMGNDPTVAYVNFKETVRSHLASLGEERL